MSANLMSLARSGGKFLKLFGDRKMMKTTPTARDYVQDGLIAMWDGIENAGWGVHDPNATVWKDLAGGIGDLPLLAGVVVNEKSISFNRKSATIYASYTIPKTIEVCIYHESTKVLEYALVNLGTKKSFTEEIRLFPYVYRDRIQPYYRRSIPKEVVATIPNCSISQVIGSTFRLFMNGSHVGDGSIYSFDPNQKFSSFSLGDYNSYGVIDTVYFVRMYSIELNADEIAANYAIDKARFNLTTPTI